MSRDAPTAGHYCLLGIVVALLMIFGTIEDAPPRAINLTAADCAAVTCPGVMP